VLEQPFEDRRLRVVARHRTGFGHIAHDARRSGECPLFIRCASRLVRSVRTLKKPIAEWGIRPIRPRPRTRQDIVSSS
jgi:hypothetical protein